jgi:hypothetical protein
MAKEHLQNQSKPVCILEFWSQTMRFGWGERYESRGSHAVLRGTGVIVTGLLSLQI